MSPPEEPGREPGPESGNEPGHMPGHVPGHMPGHVPSRSPLRWSVRLLGAVEAVGSAQTVSHWPTRAVACLLARLALAPDRAHPREELIELLWPGVPIEAGRNRLRQALSSLKSLLEPPSSSSTVLLADRMTVRVSPGALECDAVRFEAWLRAGDTERARRLYGGELMPGFYEDWVASERLRLGALFERLDSGFASAGPGPLARLGGPAAGPPGALPGHGLQSSLPSGLSTGLPSYWTRAYGLELTALRLRALVSAQRLVTVHGPGGSGKTRLAVAVAQACCDGPEGPDGALGGASKSVPGGVPGSTPSAALGATPIATPITMSAADPPGLPFARVVFVSLIDCHQAEHALDALCAALRIHGGGNPRAHIVATLSARRTLLVLDNLEQLVREAGLEIAHLLSNVASLHVLVTSRRLLEQDGEHAFELEGMPLPGADMSGDAAATNPAVALFIDRAQAARMDFRCDAGQARAVSELVRLLGGMPLAIELAASRVRSLTAAELLRRLSDDPGTPMLDLLTRAAPRASADTRHASMRHVVAWSWEQLSPPQRDLLLALSVFGAGARVEAVAAAAASDLSRARALLDEMHDGSWVQVTDGADGVARFSLLQPVREFAAERQPAAAAKLARARLRRWLIGFARDVALDVAPTGPTAITHDVAHVHAAILSAPADGAGRAALELAVALRGYWDTDAMPQSILLALEQGLADDGGERADPTPSASPAELRRLHFEAHELLAHARANAGFGETSLAHAQAALALASDDQQRSLALVRWAWCEYHAGHFDASIDAALNEACELADRSGDLVAQASVLRIQALVAANFRLDFTSAEALAARCQRLWERLGNRPMAYIALNNRATMWAWMGRNDEALTVLAECERAVLADHDWSGAMHASRQLGRVYVRTRRWHDALAAYRRSVRLAWQRHALQGLAHALLHVPEALVMLGQAEAAARLNGFAVAHWQRLYNGINRIEARELRRTRLLLHLHLGAALGEALRMEGSTLSIAQAVALALQPQPPAAG